MNGISLTASMRSNLLSLQNISGQVSSTQNKLATGNKVNSAIDNPSSYYTARSLNNRADDLNALLDSMGQAVSTIKAATTALESATEFLEQAKAVANQALETAKVPDKSFFEEKVGENGAVVTTAQELRDAVAAGKETICVYGAIDLGDISTSGGLSLKENQKLVGVGYFGNYDTDTNKFSSISATANVADQNLIKAVGNNSTISDLSLNFSNTNTTGNAYVIYVYGAGVKTDLANLDIKADFADSSYGKAAIYSISDSVANIKDKINLQISGQKGHGIYTSTSEANISANAKISIKTEGDGGFGIHIFNNSKLTINSGAKIDIQTSGQGGHGLSGSTTATIDINSGTKIDIKTSSQGGHGIYAATNASFNINSGAEINIHIYGQNGHGIYAHNSSTYNIAGNIYIKTENGYGLATATTGDNTVNILSATQIYFVTSNSGIYNRYNDGAGANILNIANGAKLAFEKDGKVNRYEVKASWQDKNDSTTTSNSITLDNIKDRLNVEETTAWELPEEIREDSKEEIAQDLSGDSKQYQEIMNQYDALIKDANYKGINLLQPERLTVKFNEDNTAALEVQGRDMSSKALGFTIFEWQTQEDVNKSIEELSSAINAIRNYSSELGNNYNIITTRQDFTDSLINVLTEGADKLTLADMNEESANMLALQTRQQLAINSLSLASQASQSILKLF